MRRRRFDHLYLELCLTLGARLPRFELWMALAEAGSTPEDLARGDALAFCDEGLQTFLRSRGYRLGPVPARRLRRAVALFDPRYPTPYERLAALTG